MDRENLRSIAERLARIPAAQRKSLLSRVVDHSPQAPVPQSRPGDRLPLSPGQRQLWTVQRLRPQDPAYTFAVAVRLRGRLKVGLLASAFRVLADRHYMLRTSFPDDGGGPVQYIHPQAVGEMLHIDLTSLPREEADHWLSAFIEDEVGRTFDPRTLPLMEKVLIQIDATEHLLLLTLHHILCDEWSIGVLINEVGLAYNFGTLPKPAALPPLPIQYADYAVWQNSREKRGYFSRQIEYWKTALEDLPDLLLPVDYQRSTARTFGGDVVTLAFPAIAAAYVYEAAAAADCTAFIVLLALFQSFLAEWSGCTDFGVGSPAANRDAPLTAGLIGYFVNTIVTRARIDRAASFQSLLNNVRRTAIEAYSNQEAPFALVVDTVRPSRRYDDTPLFRVMFMLQTATLPSLSLQGLEGKVVAVPRRTSKFDLTLLVREGRDGLLLDWNFATDLFCRDTISAAAERFNKWADVLLRFPDVSLNALSVQVHAASPAALAY